MLRSPDSEHLINQSPLLGEVLKSLDPPPPLIKKDSISVGNAAVPRPGSHSQNRVSTSLRKAEVPRPGLASNKLAKDLAPTKLNRVIKLQDKAGAGKSLSGARPKTSFK